MQLVIPKISCDLAKLALLGTLYKRILEALKSKSESRFELSVKREYI